MDKFCGSYWNTEGYFIWWGDVMELECPWKGKTPQEWKKETNSLQKQIMMPALRPDQIKCLRLSGWIKRTNSENAVRGRFGYFMRFLVHLSYDEMLCCFFGAEILFPLRGYYLQLFSAETSLKRNLEPNKQRKRERCKPVKVGLLH